MTHDYDRVPTTVEEAKELHDEVHAEQNRLYWLFTRTASSPPVPAKVTRRLYQLKRWIWDLERDRPLRGEEG